MQPTETGRPSLSASVSRIGLQVTATVVVALVAAAVVIPIIVLIVLSLQTAVVIGDGPLTLDHYIALLQDPSNATTLVNTIVFTVGSALLAVALGTVMAWAVTSINVPGRNVLRILPLGVLILPPLIKDPAWIMMFAPKTGLVNIAIRSVFGIEQSVFNIYSMSGMIAVMGFFTAPIAYIVMLRPLEAIDASFIEASRVSGARLARTLLKVHLPMILPAILSASTLLVISIAGSFETPVIIGRPAEVYTYMTRLYLIMGSPAPDVNAAAAQSSLYLVLTVVMVFFYIWATRNERRFVTVGGRGQARAVTNAPVLRWVLAAFLLFYSTLSFLAPLVITTLTSFVPFYTTVYGNPFTTFTLANYQRVFATPNLVEAIVTSGWLSLFTVVGVVILGGLLSFVSLKSRSRWRRAAEFIGMAPIAIPGLVYSIALLVTVLSIPSVTSFMYGSRWLLVVALIIAFLPMTMRLMSSSLIQLDDQLLEASRVSGASLARTLRSIVTPILWPAILYASGVVFVLAYRELGAVVLLVSSNTTIVPFVSFALWVSGGFPMVAALNMITMVIPLIFLVIVVALPSLGRRASTARSRGSAVAPAGVPIAARPGGV